MNPQSQLAERIADSSARVAIIGGGYVGLPLAGVFHDAGFRVSVFDVDQTKVDSLREGRSYIHHLTQAFYDAIRASDRFHATSNFRELADHDAILVCVPTPLDDQHEPDLSFVRETGLAIGAALRRGQLIVLESTTYPGTTTGVFKDAICSAPHGLLPEHDFFLCYSPERENPGDPEHATKGVPKLVGGAGPISRDIGAALYARAIETVVPVESCEIAEAAKLLENVFRAVNIALVNECKAIFDAMDIDVWEVIRAASTKPFGYMPFYPGPGLGGHCIPIDPFYLASRAREAGHPSRFVELAGEVNSAMPGRVVARVAEALESRGTPARGARVLVLGVSYKPNIDDVRESPSFELIERLEALGAAVDYSDPHVPATWKMRRHDVHKTSVPLDEETIASYDALLVATAHDAFDWRLISERARLVIDTRDVLRPFEAEMADRLVRA